jgi:GTP-binding protein HflX
MRKAILAIIEYKKEKISFENRINECVNLAKADDIEIVAQISQKSFSADPVFGFRSGKMEELKLLVDEEDVDLIVFANNLKMIQITNLANYFDLDVLDRTNLILDIFKNNAVTKEAKLQTEVAFLKYNLQRYLNLDLDIDREVGGDVRSKGKGETKGDLQKRKFYQKIHHLNSELKQLQAQSKVSRKQQESSQLKKVALVGYTNAGKSSLMNRLLDNMDKNNKKVLEKDMLFATLDSVCRNIKLNDHNILLYDTIGFVSDLPHELVKAFKSTLDVAKEADLLLEIIDASDDDYLIHKDVVDETLEDIGCKDINKIVVYNKVDLINENIENGISISCETGFNIEKLIEEIEIKLYEEDIEEIVTIAYNQDYLLYQFQNIIVINKLSEDENGITYKLKGPKSIIDRFK